MIYTRFGSEVVIVAGNIDTGEVDVKRIGDGKLFQTYVYELRATDGISEIVKAINDLNLKSEVKQ